MAQIRDNHLVETVVGKWPTILLSVVSLIEEMVHLRKVLSLERREQLLTALSNISDVV